MRTDRYRETSKSGRRRTLRLLLILIALLAAAIVCLVAYSYKATKDSLSLSFTEEAPVIEFGDKRSSLDYVKDASGEVSASGQFLDSSSIGDKEMTYTVSRSKYGGLMKLSKNYTLKYSVRDSEAPLVLWNGSGTVIELGNDFEISDVLAYGDNADPEPKLDVSGKVNTKKAGEYPLRAVITDSSGNSTKADIRVVVEESVPESSDDAERTEFGDFRAEHKGDGRSFGIDVSTWQGGVDFDAVKKAGCEFVMIRIGYSSDGNFIMDSRFQRNIENAQAAGLKVGIYLYTSDNSESDIRASAGWVADKLKGAKLDLPVAFDWEDFSHFQQYKMSFADLNRLYDAFEEEITGSGYDCMLYGSRNYLEKVWTDTEKRPVWLAHYTDKTDYEGPYRMWQASCTGSISGIDGDVDMDILFD